jgi:hypothetical protein
MKAGEAVYVHNASLPMLESDYTGADRVWIDTIPQYFKVTDFIFRKSWIEIHKKRFNLYVDPVLNMSVGSDLTKDSLLNNFRNTRGFLIRGDIGPKFSFETSFYENQARYLDYQTNYFKSKGELYYNNNNGTYFRQNAVVNGMGRTKPFKVDGLDHAFATGYVSYKPIKQLSLQFGYGAHFIGNGYRSLLLSDNSFKYPYLKINSNFWKNRFQYTVIYASTNNLIRMPATTSTESLFEKKGATFHFLDFAVTKKFNIGLFEGIAWSRSDSSGVKKFNYNYINPVIFVNTAIYGMENAKANSVIGMNFSLRYIPMTEVYGQFMVDGFKQNKFGYQVGIKTFDLFTLDFNMQLEYNYVSPYTYAHEDPRQSYSHYNLPMAHPAGGGFHEIVFKASYEWKRLFIKIKSNLYSKRFEFGNENTGTNPLVSDGAKQNSTKNSLIYLQSVEFGYRFNKRNSLQIFGGWQGRAYEHPDHKETSHYLFFGIKTTFINENFDF